MPLSSPIFLKEENTRARVLPCLILCHPMSCFPTPMNYQLQMHEENHPQANSHTCYEV